MNEWFYFKVSSQNDHIEDLGQSQSGCFISGIDPDEWRICGVDIRFSYGEPSRAGVFAVERSRFDEAGQDWARLAADHDDVVPVTEFTLPAARASEILGLFPDLSLVAARASAVEGEGLAMRVAERVMTVPALVS